MGGWTNPANDPQLSSLLPKPTTGYGTTTAGSSFGATLAPGQSSSSRLQAQAATLGGQGSDAVTSGIGLLGKPLDYWQNLLKAPTKQSLTEQQGPAFSSVVGQYSTGKKALAQQPRGGGTSALAGELPFQEAGALTGLLEQQLSQTLNVLQPEAAQAITGIAQGLSDLGLGELGWSSQDLSALLAADITKRGQTMEALGGLGKGLGGIISTLINRLVPQAGA